MKFLYIRLHIECVHASPFVFLGMIFINVVSLSQNICILLIFNSLVRLFSKRAILVNTLLARCTLASCRGESCLHLYIAKKQEYHFIILMYSSLISKIKYVIC